MSSDYNDSYYKTLYINPLHNRLGLANLYYLWIAYFCIIIPSKLKKADIILDFGCGIGNFVWALRKLGMNAYGIDPSISAKKFSKASKYCKYSPTKHLPYPNSYFDLVYSNEVLEHIKEKDLNHFLKEMHRVSKGKMIHILGVKDRGKMVTDDPTHLTIKTESWWEKKFNQLGYETKKGNHFYFFPHIFSRKINLTSIKKGYFLINKK